MKRGNWTDNPCFYVSVVDGPRFNVIAGPFRTHDEALQMVEPARKIGTAKDPRAHFYEFGTVKMANGYREGMLNADLNI